MPGTLHVNKIGAATGTEISVETSHSMTFATTQFKLTGGTAGQAITTDGSGNLTFADVTSDPTMGGDLSGLASNAQIVANAVGTTEIATDAITANEIAAGAVGSSEIAAGAVGSSEIAADAVSSNEITAGAVGTTEIATGAVTANEIASTIDLSSKTITLPVASVTEHVTQTDTSVIENNIALLAFKVATGDSLSTFQMVDQVIDDFVDVTGVDSGTSTNANIGGGYYSGVATGGYFGSASDGDLTTSGNVTHTVQNKYGSYDGDMVVKNYNNLTISAGHTMTVDQPCRGMLIYVDGDCTIDGTLSMLGMGANATPSASGGAGASHADGLMISYKKVGGVTLTSGSDLSGCGSAAIAAVANHPTSGNGYVLQIPRVGGNGGATRSSSGGGNTGNVGDAGLNGTISTIYKQLSFGGGGSGGAYWDGNSCGGGDAVSGRGGHSTCWSGGTGGGGKMSGSTAYAGDDYGGQGGQGHNNHCGGSHSASGGMGNPCGLDVYTNSNSTTQYTGASGTGGLLILMVRGNLTVGASGIITTEGVANINSGRSLPGGCYGSGGSSGGGALAVLHGGTYSDSGSVTSAGGIGINHGTATGGTGGAGGKLIEQVVASIEGDMSLVSNTSTAEATPTVGDIVMLMEDGVGTATINTDIIAYISRDAGTNWSSAVTLVDEGNWGTNKKILVARNVDISSLAGTTSMRYKIDTANQSTTLDTRVHAVSLAWS